MRQKSRNLKAAAVAITSFALVVLVFQNCAGFKSAVAIDPAQGLADVVAPAGNVVNVSASLQVASGSSKAFATLSSALDSVRSTGGTILLSDATTQGPITIDGVKQPLLIKPATGSADINCSSKLTGWSRVSGSVYQVKTAAPISQVFYHGDFLNRARYPTSGFLSVSADSATAVAKSTLTMNASDVSALPSKDFTNATLVVRNADFLSASGVVGSFDSSKGLFSLNAQPAQPSDCTQSSCAFTYNVTAGWGYYLQNKLWMMTAGAGEPGTWAFDASTSMLYVWLPDGSDPSLATDLLAANDVPACLTISNSPQLTIQSVAVRNSGRDGIFTFASAGLRLSQILVDHPKRHGAYINDSGLTIDHSTITNTGEAGLLFNYQPTVSTIESNTFEHIGTAPDKGLSATGIGISSFTAQSQIGTLFYSVHGNSLSDISGGGISVGYSTIVDDNIVNNFCVKYDDCGGIYIGGRNKTPNYATAVTIKNNIVTTASANLVGKPAGRGPYPVPAIYLDDYAHDTTVTGNMTANTDIGLFGHNYHDNTFTGNTFAATHPLRAQEDSLLKTIDLATGIQYYVNQDGSLTPASQPPAANASLSFSKNTFTDNQFIATTYKNQLVLYITSNQSAAPAHAKDAFLGSGNTFVNLFGPVENVVLSQLGTTSDLESLGLDTSVRSVPTRALNVPPIEVTNSAASIYEFSSSASSGFANYVNSGGTITSPIATCPITSSSGACLRVTTSSNAVNAQLIKPLEVALSKNSAYLVHVEMLKVGGASCLSPTFIRNGPSYESLDAFAQSQNECLESTSAWTTFEFQFQPTVDLAAHQSRINFNLPAGFDAYVGALTITPVSGVPTVPTDFAQVLVNSDVSASDLSCADLGSSCTGWKDLSGAAASAATVLPARSVDPFWK